MLIVRRISSLWLSIAILIGLGGFGSVNAVAQNSIKNGTTKKDSRDLIDPDRAAKKKAMSRLKRRFTEAQRRAIYLEDALAEEKALEVAKRQIPLPKRNYTPAQYRAAFEAQTRLFHKLQPRYRQRVARAHRISILELEAISDEGFAKMWPVFAR